MKKTYHHGDLRAALLQAGLEMLETDGLQGISLRSLGARVGVSHTALVRHFSGMKSFYTALAADGYRRHRVAMVQGVTEHASREEKLMVAAHGYVRFALEQPALFHIMFSPDHVDFQDPVYREASLASRAVLVDIAQGLDWPRRSDKAPQMQTEVMLWSIVHGYAVLALNRELPTGEDGMPILSINDVFPDFSYR